MADIGFFGWQSIVDRLTTPADDWRIGVIALFR